MCVVGVHSWDKLARCLSCQIWKLKCCSENNIVFDGDCRTVETCFVGAVCCECWDVYFISHWSMFHCWTVVLCCLGKNWLHIVNLVFDSKHRNVETCVVSASCREWRDVCLTPNMLRSESWTVVLGRLAKNWLRIVYSVSDSDFRTVETCVVGVVYVPWTCLVPVTEERLSAYAPIVRFYFPLTDSVHA